MRSAKDSQRVKIWLIFIVVSSPPDPRPEAMPEESNSLPGPFPCSLPLGTVSKWVCAYFTLEFFGFDYKPKVFGQWV